MPASADPVMLRFRSALDAAFDAAFGPRIERVVLLGSRVRGDHRPDSDDDVAVFLKDCESFGRDSSILSDIETDILFDTGALIDAMPLHAGSHADRTIFMAEVRREGVDL